MKNKLFRFGAYALLLVLTCGPLLAGQKQKEKEKEKGKETTQAQAQEPARPSGPQARTKEEFEAYQLFRTESDFAKQVVLGEKFLKDFPDTQLQNVAFQVLMIAFQNLNNYEKTVEYGEKLVALEPNNLAGQITLATIIPERIRDQDLERDAKLQSAATHAQKAIEIINAMPRPQAMTDDQWVREKNQVLASAHASFGLVELHKKNYAGSIKHYLDSAKFFDGDPVVYFRLGFAYEAADKRDDAIQALARSVALKGMTESLAREYLEKLYKAKHGSTAGLDKLIEEAGKPKSQS